MCGVVARLMTFGSYMDNISVPCGWGGGGVWLCGIYASLIYFIICVFIGVFLIRKQYFSDG